MPSARPAGIAAPSAGIALMLSRGRPSAGAGAVHLVGGRRRTRVPDQEALRR